MFHTAASAIANIATTLPTTITTIKPLLPRGQNSLPIRKLTTSELQARLGKGLCYNYDERCYPGHKCKSQFFLLS